MNAATISTPNTLPATARMQAILRDRYGSEEVLRLGEIAVPRPAEGQVLLRVEAAALDRSAYHTMTGKPYLIRLMGYGLRKPNAPRLGAEVAGVIEAVGQGVTELKPGDRVFGTGQGSFAEYALANPARLAPIPEGTSFETAAALPISGLTALQALRNHGQVQAGQRVLILGASGGVGTYAVQLARVFGAQVTGVCSSAKMGLVRDLGAQEVVDYARSDLRNLGRFDLILDIGGNRPVGALRRLMTRQGTLVFIGGERGDPLTGGMGRQLGALLASRFSQHKVKTFIATVNSADLRTIAELQRSGQIRPVIDRICTLADVPQAMRDLEAGLVRGKVVFQISKH